MSAIHNALVHILQTRLMLHYVFYPLITLERKSWDPYPNISPDRPISPVVSSHSLAFSTFIPLWICGSVVVLGFGLVLAVSCHWFWPPCSKQSNENRAQTPCSSKLPRSYLNRLPSPSAENDPLLIRTAEKGLSDILEAWPWILPLGVASFLFGFAYADLLEGFHRRLARPIARRFIQHVSIVFFHCISLRDSIDSYIRVLLAILWQGDDSRDVFTPAEVVLTSYETFANDDESAIGRPLPAGGAQRIIASDFKSFLEEPHGSPSAYGAALRGALLRALPFLDYPWVSGVGRGLMYWFIWFCVLLRRSVRSSYNTREVTSEENEGNPRPDADGHGARNGQSSAGIQTFRDSKQRDEDRGVSNDSAKNVMSCCSQSKSATESGSDAPANPSTMQDPRQGENRATSPPLKPSLKTQGRPSSRFGPPSTSSVAQPVPDSVPQLPATRSSTSKGVSPLICRNCALKSSLNAQSVNMPRQQSKPQELQDTHLPIIEAQATKDAQTAKSVLEVPTSCKGTLPVNTLPQVHPPHESSQPTPDAQTSMIPKPSELTMPKNEQASPMHVPVQQTSRPSSEVQTFNDPVARRVSSARLKSGKPMVTAILTEHDTPEIDTESTKNQNTGKSALAAPSNSKHTSLANVLQREQPREHALPATGLEAQRDKDRNAGRIALGVPKAAALVADVVGRDRHEFEGAKRQTTEDVYKTHDARNERGLNTVPPSMNSPSCFPVNVSSRDPAAPRSHYRAPSSAIPIVAPPPMAMPRRETLAATTNRPYVSPMPPVHLAAHRPPQHPAARTTIPMSTQSTNPMSMPVTGREFVPRMQSFSNQVRTAHDLGDPRAALVIPPPIPVMVPVPADMMYYTTPMPEVIGNIPGPTHFYNREGYFVPPRHRERGQ